MAIEIEFQRIPYRLHSRTVGWLSGKVVFEAHLWEPVINAIWLDWYDDDGELQDRRFRLVSMSASYDAIEAELMKELGGYARERLIEEGELPGER